jgi:hypothetical protein
MSVTELINFKIVVACIYRTPHGAFKKCLFNLDLVTEKVYKKGRKPILCGDWNVDFLKDSAKQQLLQNLVACNNLTNTVTPPPRITRNSQSLVDVLILNKCETENSISVLDLGYSDCFAQILSMKTEQPRTSTTKLFRRKFAIRNIEQLNYFLEEQSWFDICIPEMTQTPVIIYS